MPQPVFCETYLLLKYSLINLRDNIKEYVASFLRPPEKGSRRRRSSGTSKSTSPRISRSEEVGTNNSTPRSSLHTESEKPGPKQGKPKRLSFQDDYVRSPSQRASDASDDSSGHFVEETISVEIHAYDISSPIVTEPKRWSELNKPEQVGPNDNKPEQVGPNDNKPELSQSVESGQDQLLQTRQVFQVTRAIQTESDESTPSSEEPVTNKNALKSYKLLAAAKLVCSDVTTRLVDALYEKFCSELPVETPPSPAPEDPELDGLRKTYSRDPKAFENFQPPSNITASLSFYNQEIVDSLLEKLQPKKNKSPEKNKSQRAKPLGSLPNLTLSQYRPHSAYTNNILPDEYGKGIIGPNPYSKSGNSYSNSVYHEPPSAPKVTWAPEKTERDIDTKEDNKDQPQGASLETSVRDPTIGWYKIPQLEPGKPFDSIQFPRLGDSPSLRPSRYPRSASLERSRMGRMNSLDDHERKIIIEFCHLLEKSKQLFNGLRELPQYGHKQWHAYFGKTFDVYTKLWKFQQQHRAILDSKYGLKRWQIGEIASKIGQLYYHFYLRTSDTAFLNEAFSFYYAIRGRSYYTQACKEDKCELMVKKLRYYARFIVASLLLKKVHLVSELLRELDRQIIEYGNAYEPDDQNEWRIVADEVRTFIEVETVVDVTHPREYPCVLSHRLSAPLGPPAQSALDRVSPMTLTLREALIIGSNSTQLKFSELSIDMFRIMQTLEREPHSDVNHLYDESPRQRNPPAPSAINNKGYNLDGSYNTGEAPHKQMLFKPSPNQIFLYLASAIDDLPPNGVVLLYMSAEGLIVPNSKHPEEAGGYDAGGLITTSKTDVLQRETSSSKDKASVTKLKESPVLYPGDLYPFTRRPLFLIVDSDNSYIFTNLPRHFSQPLIILMSPIELPSTLYPGMDDQRMEGSLFTLFLHDPLSAICLCCDIKRMTLDEWERAQVLIDGYLKEAAILLSRIRENAYVTFLGDDFLRLLILRFIFCETVLRMHRMFRGRSQRTRCSPALPDDLFEHPILTRIVMELATKLQVRGHFHDPAAVQRE